MKVHAPYPPYKYNLWTSRSEEMGVGLKGGNNSCYKCKLFEPNKMLLRNEVSWKGASTQKSFRLYEQWSNVEE